MLPIDADLGRLLQKQTRFAGNERAVSGSACEQGDSCTLLSCSGAGCGTVNCWSVAVALTMT
jgi:hypothetical protein